ncbi:methionyl-tRNA formyltransferase [Candidatus Jorgensenbacteria bacterium CG10_big_fil_rev_8_21_14_0_10_54_38]|uniref:Methionyl-tRNA formyltransferase n=1 Tax=Candidatus Jorgensenbacteria bacterium CG10_big_fil_rev_8_21_14_0_10_54_38 TaxID=1974593 RepID=A0A2M6WGK3_9BACT|nr:MAG: methionyl-tRNA formyltransferase [Candidatus Jorgensenbacteria bacterium CG10_big_fil_rev_8_21_14_0_10_54_38]
MKYAFWGTPEFAAVVLEKLIGAGFLPAIVVCNPDRPVGRKRVVTPPPVKQSILEQSEDTREQITLLQPEHPLEIRAALQDAACDFFVVAAYARILPSEILSIPRLGTVGVHPSLLPRLRGSTPIQTAILEGDAEVGTTLFVLDEQIDHGPILAQTALPDYVPDTTGYETLMRELAALSAELLIETIPRFAEGMITPRPQDETLATFTKKFATTDGFVDLEKDDPRRVMRKVLALNPEPGVYTMKDGKRMKILDAEIRDGALRLRTVQYEGKKPQTLF